MPSITIQQAQAQLADLIHRLPPGDQVVITENDVPIATLARAEPKTRQPRKAGSAQGKIFLGN